MPNPDLNPIHLLTLKLFFEIVRNRQSDLTSNTFHILSVELLF